MHDGGVHAVGDVINNGSLDSCKANPVRSDTDWMRGRRFWIQLISDVYPEPFPDLFNRPSRVLGDQWLRIGRGALKRRQVGQSAYVA